MREKRHVLVKPVRKRKPAIRRGILSSNRYAQSKGGPKDGMCYRSIDNLKKRGGGGGAALGIASKVW